MADGLLGVAGRVVEREAGAEHPEEDGGAHARDRRHVQLPHEEVPLAILHLMMMDACMHERSRARFNWKTILLKIHQKSCQKFTTKKSCN